VSIYVDRETLVPVRSDLVRDHRLDQLPTTRVDLRVDQLGHDRRFDGPEGRPDYARRREDPLADRGPDVVQVRLLSSREEETERSRTSSGLGPFVDRVRPESDLVFRDRERGPIRTESEKEKVMEVPKRPGRDCPGHREEATLRMFAQIPDKSARASGSGVLQAVCFVGHDQIRGQVFDLVGPGDAA